MSDDGNEQVEQRRRKLAELRKLGNPFPNDFKRKDLMGDLRRSYEALTAEELTATPTEVVVAGRMMSQRVMGKVSFADLQDVSGRIQLYVARDELPEGAYAQFKRWDIGDILGVEGTMFKTKKGELSVRVRELRLLTKSLQPLPEKYHGLTDTEMRYRQRYVDLIMNEHSRRTFKLRSAVVSEIRRYLQSRDYLEVETPMMQGIPGGAVARPFVTRHNALDMELYLRIAPELYLKRLVVGGFERVFEINRNFRNEGVSTQHNPEFTMLEFYQAYADCGDMMDHTEQMLRECAHKVLGTTQFDYQGTSIDLGPPFARRTMEEAILAVNPEVTSTMLGDEDQARGLAAKLGISLEDSYGLGKVVLEIFEATAESKLAAPTFITEHPVEVSPLSRASDTNPSVTERFELFIAGREIANGFSELNDPEEQARRFQAQVANRDSGDEEAMYFDDDYIRALEYGLPPCGGQGMGIDRVVMLLANAPSIRDVLLFPLMRRS